jgi:hypothetical protein
MAQRFARMTVRVDELAGFRAAIIASREPGEDEVCERLLGQLASLEARAIDADPGAELMFAPPPGGTALARRALEHLHARPLRRRIRRERERERPRRRFAR